MRIVCHTSGVAHYFFVNIIWLFLISSRKRLYIFGLLTIFVNINNADNKSTSCFQE